jgi:hypothetical protein
MHDAHQLAVYDAIHRPLLSLNQGQKKRLDGAAGDCRLIVGVVFLGSWKVRVQKFMFAELGIWLTASSLCEWPTCLFPMLSSCILPVVKKVVCYFLFLFFFYLFIFFLGW